MWLLDEKGADVNGTTSRGFTPLHNTRSLDILTALSIIHLLQAGGNPGLTNNAGETPLAYLQNHNQNPSHHTTIALLEQISDAEKTSFLVKARRLAVATASNTVAPSCLQARMARGQPLPRMTSMPMTGGQNEDE